MSNTINKPVSPELDAGATAGGNVGRLFGDRYLAVQVLHTRRSVETLLATDTASDELVVVTALPVQFAPPNAQLRLEREAAVLREAACPFLAPPQVVGCEQQRLCLVRPFVPGVALEDLLRRGPLNLVDFLTVATCLLSALKEAHSRRVLHGDIRPANIIVDPDTPLSKAVAVDFDLARALPLPAPSNEESAETARYQSPEQAGSLDHYVAEPSDLYSAGVVLFECLAGRVPFDGESVGEILFAHMTARPPELRSLGLEIPRALDELIQRLLRKAPGDRYQSAEAVLADLANIAAALSAGVHEPSCVVGSHDRRPTLTEPAFVGRSHELQELDEQILRTQAGCGTLVVVESESGGGKTRLLTELASRGAQKGLWVLRGQGCDQVGQQPFQVLGGVVGQLVEATRSDPALADAVRSRLGDHCDAAVAAVPELKAALGRETSSLLGPEAFAENRSIQALAGLLDALGSKNRPAMIILDDCQWADELTVKLIVQWLANRNSPSRSGDHALLVVAFRSEEVPADHLLRKIAATLHLRLARFEADDVRRLAESMAGPLPAEAVDVVVELAEGCPFMASAMLRGMVESGALVAEPQGWHIEPLAMADLHSSNWAAGFLSRRIELLPPPTIDLLVVGAVLGKEFDLTLAAEIVGQSLPEVVRVLDTARERHFVWVRPDGIHCAFVHDKIRSALLARLSSITRRRLHEQVAVSLQRNAPDRVFDLAYHFDAAGQSERALVYALMAAHQARSQHSLEVAEQQYRIAERGAPVADRATQYGIAQGLGDVLMLRGRYDAAAALFEKAARLAEGECALAQIKGKLGELAFKRGDMERATLAFEEALRLLGRTVPRLTVLFVLMLVWEVAIQVLHTLLPAVFVGRREDQPSEAELLAVRLFSRLAHGCWYVRGRLQALWAHLRGLNLVERYPPTPELAQAYSEHCAGDEPDRLLQPRHRLRGEVVRPAASRLAIGGGRDNRAISTAFCSMRPRVFPSAWRSRARRCGCCSAPATTGNSTWPATKAAPPSIAWATSAAPCQAAQDMHQSGLELGDEQASGISLDIWALATGGGVPEEFLKQELKRVRHDAQGTAQVMLADGLRLMAQWQYEQAAYRFADALAVAKRAGIVNAYVAPNLAWLATALRCRAERQSGFAPQKRRALLYRAETAARRALRTARWLQNDLPHALRECAHILALQGKSRRACRLFEKSMAVAARQGAEYEHAQTLLNYGQLRRELGHPDADEQIAAAEAVLREIVISGDDADAYGRAAAAPATLSLADRFDTVLEVGRKITSALSPAMIFAEVRAAALRLLRGEHGLVLEVVRENGQDRFTPVAGCGCAGVRQRLAPPLAPGGQGGGLCRETRPTTSCRGAVDALRAHFRARPHGRLPVRGPPSRARPVRPRRGAAGGFHRHDRRGRAGERRGLPAVAATQRDSGTEGRRANGRRRGAGSGIGRSPTANWNAWRPN